MNSINHDTGPGVPGKFAVIPALSVAWTCYESGVFMHHHVNKKHDNIATSCNISEPLLGSESWLFQLGYDGCHSDILSNYPMNPRTKTEIIWTSPTKTSIWKSSSVNSLASPTSIWAAYPLSPGGAVECSSLYPFIQRLQVFALFEGKSEPDKASGWSGGLRPCIATACSAYLPG